MSVATARTKTPAGAEISRRIRETGPISVAEFMDIALAHPEHGYYRTRDPLGNKGDFITAPEISQVFGELIGAWCAVAWQQMGSPATFGLIELGPGRGTLMADALRATRKVPGFMEAAGLHLVETSPVLRKAQAETLAGTEVSWHRAVQNIPPGPMILIANEFFDALPIHQIVRGKDSWHERLVDLDGDRDALCLVTGKALIDAPAGTASDASEGTIEEHCPAAAAITKDISGRLKAHGGAALIIDYGPFGPIEPATGSSLQAVRNHLRCDPLDVPGDADLTAHVDFAALMAAAAAGGADIHGPLSQGMFLGRLGIEARTEKLCDGAGPAQREALETGCRRLIDTGTNAMGAWFKALVLTGPGQAVPAGFEGA